VFFRQILYRDLGCASYIIGDAGQAVVVDPRWDIDVYLETAATERFEITHVIDTHEHADHVSGRPALVQATGAQAHRPATGDGDGPDLIRAGDEIAVGSLAIRAVGTPGHRPEHLSFAVCDRSRGEDPWLLLTGDSLLVGDVARPDLAYEPAEGAAELYRTLGELLGLGDHVEVWPAHVGGSLCGGAGLSMKTSSTLGFERLHNPLLSAGERAFVDGVTSSLPCRPPNVDRIVGLNRRTDGRIPGEPRVLGPDAVGQLFTDGVVVLDSRSPDDFDAGHLPDAVNLPVTSPGFGTRAGWALDPESSLLIVAADEAAIRATASRLHAVGFWALSGGCVADTLEWERRGLPTACTDAWDLDRLALGILDDAVQLIDVREEREWLTGHVDGSHHVPLNRLREVELVPPPVDGRTTAVACAAGVRAAFAASLLRRAGRHGVVRVAGGGVPDLASRGVVLAGGL
jgi:glyoxylase-like metal-dependent hydrolase (beta-lactamase superfamily II)/rhodanese-related sulfurtransferase